jgi:hypothetical protein
MSTGIVLWLYLALLRFVQVNSFAPEEMAKKMEKDQKIVSLGIEPRTFPEHLLIAFVNGKS